MKILFYILMTLCGLSIIGNALAIDLNTPFQGDSLIALISIVAALCAIVLLVILIKAKQLKEKMDEKNDL